MPEKFTSSDGVYDKRLFERGEGICPGRRMTGKGEVRGTNFHMPICWCGQVAKTAWDRLMWSYKRISDIRTFAWIYLQQKKQQRVRHYAHRLRHYSSGRSLAPTRETFFSMRRAVSLELTSCVCHRKKLTVIKSRLKHSYFVCLIFIVCDSWKAPMFSIWNRRTTNAQSDDDDDDDEVL